MGLIPCHIKHRFNRGARNRCRETERCQEAGKWMKSVDGKLYKSFKSACESNRKITPNEFLSQQIGLETACNNYGLLCDEYYENGGAVETPPYIDPSGTGEIPNPPVNPQMPVNTLAAISSQGSSRALGMSFEMKVFIGLGIAAIAAALFFTKKK